MANPPYILAIDQGTTGSTVLLIDSRGEIAAHGYREFTQHYPRPGWVEHDPTEIWEVTSSVMSELICARGVGHQIAAIGVTNQRETTVVWERGTGRPIHPAIVWQCRRTAGICAALKGHGMEDRVRAKTGLVLDPYFSATKIAWILDGVDGARERAQRGELAFGTIDTWLLWNLTGGAVHATDYTNASRTMLFNIDTLAWDDELLEIFRVPRSVLPEVHPSVNVFGRTKYIAPLPDGTPIAGIAGDQQAALFGQLCTRPGMAKNTYGTGCFLMLNTGESRVHSQSGLLATLAVGAMHASPLQQPVYALEGSVFIAGAAVQWLRDGLQIIASAPETEAIALRVADTGGVFVVPAFTGLGAPYWDPNAHGAILGLTRGTTRAHIVRATLESIALQTADVVTAMRADAGIELDQLRVDGGAVANNFLMQFQADILGIDVERPTRIETTGLGAAYLAGLTVGVWQSTDELESHRKIDKIFSPQIETSQRQQKLEDWKDAVRRVMS
ncbi:glycerol kinase GlpK [Candidatus Poribacteria bacterium]|nr:glycerol kinase GlpK [Candidatus Poribacteria bacterium]